MEYELIDANDLNLTCQIVMTGSPIAGNSIHNEGGFFATPHESNSTTVYYFGTGSGSSTGFPIKTTTPVIFLPVQNLKFVSFYGTAGQVICLSKA